MYEVEYINVREFNGGGRIREEGGTKPRQFASYDEITKFVPKDLRDVDSIYKVVVYRSSDGARVGVGHRAGFNGTGNKWTWSFVGANRDLPATPVIELSPAEDKHPCCGMLRIQAHTPDCTGEVRDRRSRPALQPEQFLTLEDFDMNVGILAGDDPEIDAIVFVTPDGKRYRAHNVIKPHGKAEILVSLIEE